jgi:ribosome-binding factor A
VLHDADGLARRAFLTVSERTERLDELFAREISAIIAREIADPRVGFVTVTNVEVAPDLRHATVWVSVIGDEARRTESMRALGRAMPYVRHQLGSLHLKRIPELHLRLDDSFERGTRVLRLLDDLEAGGEAAPLPVPEPLPAPVTPRGTAEPAPRRRRSPRTRPGGGTSTPGGRRGR